MKKLISFFVLLLFCAAGMAQTVTLTFTGQDTNNKFVKLDRAVVENATQSWQETLVYPDTILKMTKTGIEDYEAANGFVLLQNNPNPFEIITYATLNTTETGEVILGLIDIHGRIVETLRTTSLQPGLHHFRIYVATPGTYLLTASLNGKTSSIKMVNNGKSAENKIEYVGNAETQFFVSLPIKNTKGETNNPFNEGDEMVFTGYATIDGKEYQSQTIRQKQTASEDFTLVFAIEAPVVTLPVVMTDSVRNITDITATCGGNVTDDGGATITERGVCYSVNSNPTVDDTKVATEGTTGAFTCTLENLVAGTTYYVRAYATNSEGTAYGNEVSFVTESVSAPVVTTSEASSVMKMSAVVGGNVVSDGDSEILERGVCYSKKQNPTVTNTKITTTGTTGPLTCALTGLEANTTYYVRAYAVNREGTAYGNQVSFTTTAGIVCGTDSITDHEGNVYHTVSIGNQCWTRENMRCKTSPSTGTTILEVPAVDASFSGKKAYCYNDNPINAEEGYGLLYNWCAAMDTFNPNYNEIHTSIVPGFAPFVKFKGNRQGVCPKGWHVPSSDEWTELTEYMSKYFACNNNKDYNAKELASARDWLEYTDSSNPCVVGVDPQYNNATDFSALPAGRYDASYGYVERRDRAYFWSATQNENANGDNRNICYRYAGVGTNYNATNVKCIGQSVRCLSDEACNGSTATAPNITTSPVSDVENTTATTGGNITDNGGTTVVASGVCWNTCQNPTISDYHTVNDTRMGSFVEKMTNLIPGTTYYVRAYATNSAGITYGEQISFTTNDGFLCGKATVSDYDGNVYNTVAVGSQCWLKENMKCTHYSDGVEISLSDESSETMAHRYYPDDNSENVNTYGYLYNWLAAMRYATSSSGTLNSVQGVCPIGWHVPSDAEWTQLTDYVSSMEQYVCNQKNKNYIAKALASDSGWHVAYNVCAVGNDQTSNNATDFTAVPAGYFGTSYKTIGGYAEFWSATQLDDFQAYSYYLNNIQAIVTRTAQYKSGGFSVRCLKD